jgi:glycosyltransferase involved in cell wall biosynthesis
LTPDVARLAEPTPDAFGAALADLLLDAERREQLGQAGRRLIAEQYNYQVFEESLNGLMDWIDPIVLQRA